MLARPPCAVGARGPSWRHEPMQLACSSGPPSLEPEQPALHRKSALFVAGDRFTYAPLARINVTFAQSLTRANLDAAMNASDAARAQWRSIASLPSGPRIAILGTRAGMLTRVVGRAPTPAALLASLRRYPAVTRHHRLSARPAGPPPRAAVPQRTCRVQAGASIAASGWTAHASSNAHGAATC